MADKKTLFHSELATLGPVRVTVKEERRASKYSKPNAPKPDYVTLLLNGAERFYTVENEGCATFFDGTKGTTFTLNASGSRESALLEYLGEQVLDSAGLAKTQPPPNRAAASRPPATKTPAAQQRPPATQQRPPGAAPKGALPHQPMGATVGMAVNNACHSLTAQGLQLEPKRIFEIASDILRVSYNLERGKLAPRLAEREAAAKPQPPAKPEPSDNDGGAPPEEVAF
jgi:hypothetical protein